MKLSLVIAALVSVTLAVPSAGCFCEVPKCPLELIAECKCKNAAALGCYKKWTEAGYACPKPTPTPCGVIAREEVAVPTVPPTALRCGGIIGTACPEGYRCIDDIRDTCDPKHGGADCLGICVRPDEAAFCGGLKGFLCKKGEVCVDNPWDTCDPIKGGRDCGGICVNFEESEW